MRKKKGVFLVTAGVLLVAAALLLALYNIWDGDRARRASDEISAILDERLREQYGEDAPVKAERQPKFTDYVQTVPEMPVEVIDGYAYIGTLEIPVFDLVLPVMDHWDYDRLKISPCRYSGSYFTDDLVICAHNYARHFSPIKWIDPGTDVYFRTVDNVLYHYQVSNRETLQPTSVDQMTENRNNSEETAVWDMTLFTCNTGGQTRCAVRCVLVE